MLSIDVVSVLVVLSTHLFIATCLQHVTFYCEWTGSIDHGLPLSPHHKLRCRPEMQTATGQAYSVDRPPQADGHYRLCNVFSPMQAEKPRCFNECLVYHNSSARLIYASNHPLALRQSLVFKCLLRDANRLSQSHLPRQKRSALPPPIPPGDLELVSVTEDNAQLSWHPPRPVAPPDDTGSGEQINYRVEIKPENSPRKFSVMTEEPRISFEELRPNTLYEISVYSYRPADGLASLTAKHIQVTTKAEVYRLPMVANPKAESTDFATLKVSWELPHVERSEKPEAQIAYYRIMLYNLAAEGTPHSRRWVPYKVPGGARVTAYTISNLQPDSFYKIRIFAVSAIGVDGHPATISSSPRIISRPPSGAPLEVVLSDVGALTAAFTWLPPHESERNGEIVAYQLEFNSPEWLAPRELTVADSLNYTITGLNPMTNYTLTIAAATRAGIGPKSSPLLFTTALKTSQIDKEVQEPREDSFDHPGFVDSGVATLPPLKVHNLRYVAQERNILLLWSIPPISASPHRFKGCIVRWGLIYPGPNKAEVNLEKRAFSIEPLEPSTTYMISVALLTDDGEGPVEIITAQTKPVSSAKDSLIPLNVRVLSVGTDWAIMAWDSPTCSALEDEFEASRASSRRTTQRASPCASGTFPLTYQLRYDIIDPKEAANVAFANCPDDSRKTASEVRVNVTWVRLEHLKAGSRYVACVRAITSDPSSASSAKTRIGDWSFVQIFETQEPESPPADPQAQGESTLSLVNQSSNETTPKPEKPSLNFNSSFVEGPRSSGLLGGGNSDIWLALAAIMVTTIVLMIIVIVVVCWAKRSPIMVVGYKPEQHGGGGGSLAEASVNLLSSSKGQRMGGGEAVGEKITLQKFSTSKAPENQLVDFTAKSQAETWTMDSDSMQIAVPASRAAVGPPVMGVRSAVDPMGGGGGGGGSDAASRGATGSSASSAVSLLPPTVGGKPNPSFVSPTGNPLINPGPNVPAYSMYPSAQPQLGTFAQTYYHQHQPPLQNSAIYPTPTTGGYIRGVANLPPVPPPPPFPPPSAAGTMITPSNIGGPRIDLRAGENDGTYLQYPVLPIYRGHMAVNAPCVNASDLISDSSSGVPSSIVLGVSSMAPATASAGVGNRQSAVTVSDGGNPVDFSAVSSSNSSSQNHHHPHLGQELRAQTCYNSLPAKKEKAHTSANGGTPEAVKAISTEELSQEMANLDGLMKDLSMITQNEFGCLQP